MSLPDILAGPIVRRVTADAIHVWICTSKPFDLGLGIAVQETKLDKNKKPFVLRTPIGEGRGLRRLRLGEKLYIHLLKAVPAKSKGAVDSLFPPGTLLSYDICKLTSAKPDKLGLSILTSSVREEISLSGADELPTVVLQKGIETDLRALFASCRKLHGPGNDAFVKTYTSRYKFTHFVNRPNVLLLMGDQIYADDVSDLLLGQLEKLSRELIGFQEQIPDKDGKVLKPEKYVKRQRQESIAKAAGFTTEEGWNHLARFGEFAAMYLLSWSGNEYFWQLKKLDDTRRLLKEAVDAYLAIRGTATPEDDKRAKEAVRWVHDIDRLKDAHKGALALRRILANTPTYMIFDDHDVTDDWNFTPAWQTAVKDNKLGSRVVANALAAYAVFQGWGNDPNAFANTDVFDSLEARFAKSNAAPSVIASYESDLYYFKKWSFLAPTVPPTLFVDSRTRREMSPGEFEYRWMKSKHDSDGAFDLVRYPKQPKSGDQLASVVANLPKSGDQLAYVVPNLIDPIAVQYLKGLVGAAVANRRLILVTPGPIFGVPAIEVGITLYTAFTSAIKTDLEGWMTNKLSFLRLMQVLKSADLDQVIMLSGDVHYAFSASGMIEYDRPNALSFTLFNSSAVKNSPEGQAKVFADMLGNREQRKQFFFLGEDDGQQTYYSSSNRLADMWPYEFRRHGVKELYTIGIDFLPLRINGEGGRIITTECNVGYLSIDKTNEAVLCDFIVRK